jgi:CheY-like chemotaxis protein
MKDAPSPAQARGQSRAPVSRSIRSRQILLVEDHADTALVIRKLLEQRGYAVQVAGSVAAAIELADELTGEPSSESRIDLVISDVGLPDGTGFELMRHLKERHGLRGICLTGQDSDDKIDPNLASDFAGHLTKPFEINQLESLINSLIA